MRIIYEAKLSGGTAYPAHKQTERSHGGREYSKQAKHFEALSGWDVAKRVLQISGRLLLSASIIPLLSSGFRQKISTLAKEIGRRQEKVVHYVEKANASATVHRTDTCIQAAYERFPDNSGDYVAADCFVQVEMEGETLLREYIIEGDEGCALSADELKDKIDDARARLLGELTQDLGAIKSIAIAALLKSADQQFHLAHSHSDASGRRSGSGYASGKAALVGITSRVNAMGFPPKSPWVQDGAFVPGPHYQPLD